MTKQKYFPVYKGPLLIREPINFKAKNWKDDYYTPVPTNTPVYNESPISNAKALGKKR